MRFALGHVPDPGSDSNGLNGPPVKHIPDSTSQAGVVSHPMLILTRPGLAWPGPVRLGLAV